MLYLQVVYYLDVTQEILNLVAGGFSTIPEVFPVDHSSP